MAEKIAPNVGLVASHAKRPINLIKKNNVLRCYVKPKLKFYPLLVPWHKCFHTSFEVSIIALTEGFFCFMDHHSGLELIKSAPKAHYPTTYCQTQTCSQHCIDLHTVFPSHGQK